MDAIDGVKKLEQKISQLQARKKMLLKKEAEKEKKESEE